MKKPILPTEPIPCVNSEPVEDLDIRLKNEPDGLLPFVAASRVTSISIGRTVNTGNFNSARYEITVDVAPNDSASGIFGVLNHVLNNVQEPLPNGRVAQYLRFVELSATQKLTPDQEEYVNSPTILAEVQTHSRKMEDWQRSLAMLDDLAGSPIYQLHRQASDDDPNFEGS